MGGLVLSIETATLACSVALFEDQKILGRISEVSHAYIHAESLLPLIDQIIKDHGKTRNQLTAVAVSSGPGSYTGLRIGVSTAKGICHALNIPLIPVGSLESLAHQAVRSNEGPWDVILTVLDARRDEVFTATFIPASDGSFTSGEVRALVLDQPLPELFPKACDLPRVCVIGDAAEKTQTLLGERVAHWTFIQCYPDAQDAWKPALSAIKDRAFADVAYFEPRYLKEFIAGKPRDLLGLRSRSAEKNLP